MEKVPGDSSVLDAVRGLVWHARRKARSALPGAHDATTRGGSAEFVEYRAYRQGDDPGRIDWKLLGRTDRVYVRLSPDRAVLSTMLVVDASASMAFPSDTLRKWTTARSLALGLAAIARHGGDPVGLAVVSSDGMRVVQPRTRRSVLDEIMRALAPLPTGGAALAPALEVAMRRAGRVVVVSDFLGDAEEQLAAVRRFAAREVHVVHLAAREELEPAEGRRLVADPEQPGLRRPMPPAARAEYLKRFAAWRTELARTWRGAGAAYTLVVAGAEPLRQTIRRIVA
jgi:uncharacterized protein (DUF58 family)